MPSCRFSSIPSTSNTAVVRRQDGLEEAGPLQQPLASFNDTFWALRPPPVVGPLLGRDESSFAQRSGDEHPGMVATDMLVGSSPNPEVGDFRSFLRRSSRRRWGHESVQTREEEGAESANDDDEESSDLTVAVDRPDVCLPSSAPCMSSDARFIGCRDVCDCDSRVGSVARERVTLPCEKHRVAPRGHGSPSEELASFGIERDLELGGPGWIQAAVDLKPVKCVFFPAPPIYSCQRVYHTGHHATGRRPRWEQARAEGFAMALRYAKSQSPARGSNTSIAATAGAASRARSWPQALEGYVARETSAAGVAESAPDGLRYRAADRPTSAWQRL